MFEGFSINNMVKNPIYAMLKPCMQFSGDIQNPPGCGPVQAALGDPALAGGWTR